MLTLLIFSSKHLKVLRIHENGGHEDGSSIRIRSRVSKASSWLLNSIAAIQPLSRLSRGNRPGRVPSIPCRYFYHTRSHSETSTILRKHCHHLDMSMRIQLLLFGLLPRIVFSAITNEFINPPPPGEAADYSTNLIWPLDSTQTIQWTSTYETYELWIYQDNGNGNGSPTSLGVFRMLPSHRLL